MEFSKCIALNSLVKKSGVRVGSRYAAVSVEFSMFSMGHWSAEIKFPRMIFSSEVDTFIAWVISNCHSYIIYGDEDHLFIAVQ